MAFKMNPKSPLLRKAMGCASPAKNMGYGSKKASSPAKQKSKGSMKSKDIMKSGGSMTAAEKKAMKDNSVFGPDGKNVAKPPKNTKKSKYDKSPAKQRTGGLDREENATNIGEILRVRGEGMGMKKELKRIKKKKPSTIEADPIKKSDPKENLARAKDPKSKRNTEVTTAAEKLRIARKKMQDAKDNKKAARLLNRAERKNIKADKNERQMERKQKRRAAKNSPAKQTAKQKANLPKKVVDAIAAKQGKSPAKLDPMTIMTAVNMAKNLKKKK